MMLTGISLAAHVAYAAVPYQMNFQGRLNDSTGAPMPNGTYNMIFRIYSSAAGGTALWSETHSVSAGKGVAITTGGLFSTQLGSVTSLPPAIFNTSTPLYLEVELPTPATATTSSPSWTEGAMAPRNPISSSPYAINSSLLNGKSDTAFAASSGSTNYIQNQSASPQTAGFKISGSGAIGGNLSASGNIALGDFTTTINIGGDNYGFKTINIGTLSNAPSTITVGSTYANSTVLLQAGSASINMSTNQILAANFDSAKAFRVQNAAGESVLNVNTTDQSIQIGKTPIVPLPPVLAFASGVTYPTGLSAASVTTGDFNGDGVPDLVTANVDDDTVSVLLGNSDGTFRTKVDYSAGAQPYSVTTGDFNGDGKLDLAVADAGNSPATISVLLGNADGTFQDRAVYYTGSDSALSSSPRATSTAMACLIW